MDVANLSQTKPSSASHIFKRNVKTNQAKRIPEAQKVRERHHFSQKSYSPCIIKIAQFEVNSLLSYLFMLRCCALGKPLAETVSFRPFADNFAVVIRQQESVCSGFRLFGVN